MKIIFNRDKWIQDLCRDKKVLHIGPCDWPYMEQKLAKGRLLFQLIDASCEDQLGVDLDEESVEKINTLNWKRSRVITQDMSFLGEIDYQPDIIIFGETIEHVENPGIALDNLRQVMGPETQLVITTPNATRLENFITALLFRNNEHPDHKVSFTFSSLSHLLVYKDFEITQGALGFIPYFDYSLTMKQSIISKGFWFIRHVLSWPLSIIWNYLAETLLFVVVVNKNK